MVNITLWWLFLLPLAMSVATLFVVPRISPAFNYLQSACAAIVALLISCLIISGAFYLGKGSKTADVEVWNGQITSKSRVHDNYTQSYQCNCITTTGSNGSSSTICSTCYEDHYTVKWSADSTIGNFAIHNLDSTSRSVYEAKDPEFYTNVEIGEPCSKKHDYTNYIKAVPESLFRPSTAAIKDKFAGMVPPYPLHMYGMWRIDRVLAVGFNIPDLHQWNSGLSDALKTIGPAKQANAIIIIANTDDPDFAYAVRDAWLNGKKNDIVLIIGAPAFPNKASWVHVLALTDNEMFKVKLRDDILALDQLTANDVINVISANTIDLFKRKSMKDFAYLDAEIDPPTWVNVLTVIFIVLLYATFWIFINITSNRVARSKFHRVY